MGYLGDIVEDATIRGSFNTRQANGTPITLAGTPALSVYKDAGTTESTAGVTLTVDFDSRTGHHVFTIDTSADAFYVTGSDYRVVITTGTVDSISVVGVCVGSFSIENRNTKANVTQISGDATAADTLELFIEALDQSTGQIDSGTFAAGAIDAAAIANGAIDAATFAADVDAEILSYIVDDATRIDASALNTASAAVGSNGSGLTEAGGDGDHLTAINLPNQTMDIVGNITGNLSGSVGSVTGAVGSVTGNVGGNVVGSVGSISGVTFPSNFAVLGINGSGHISRVTLVDTTTTNTDMITAAGIRAALGMASADLDDQLDALPTAIENADALLIRNVSNVEASAGEHTLCTVVLAMLENSISGTTLTIKRTNGTTTHVTKTLTVDDTADPITGIA